MPKYKRQSTISIVTLETIELNIPTQQFGWIDTDEEFLHQIKGEFLYCELVVDGKLFVTEKQLDEIFSIENISIHKISDSIIYVQNFSSEARKEFHNLKKEAKVCSIDNLEDDSEEDEVYYFKLL